MFFYPNESVGYLPMELRIILVLVSFCVVYRLRNVGCSSGKIYCDGTCCQMKNGSYGCCHMQYLAVCYDGLHCCAQNYTFNHQLLQCFKIDKKSDGKPTHRVLPPTELLQPHFGEKKQPTEVGCYADIACPNNVSMCYESQTCCPFDNVLGVVITKIEFVAMMGDVVASKEPFAKLGKSMCTKKRS